MIAAGCASRWVAVKHSPHYLVWGGVIRVPG